MHVNRHRIETILAERGMTKASLAENCGIRTRWDREHEAKEKPG